MGNPLRNDAVVQEMGMKESLTQGPQTWIDGRNRREKATGLSNYLNIECKGEGGTDNDLSGIKT